MDGPAGGASRVGEVFDRRVPPTGATAGPGAKPKRSGEGRSRLIATGVVLAFLAHAAVYRAYITDDAFISFRYARNLISGGGLAFNPGDPVWGYTNFLWTMVLALFARAGVEILAAARGIGVACNVLCVLLVMKGLSRKSSGLDPWRWMAGALLATHAAFVMQGASGLETSFFTALVLGAVHSYASARESRNERGFLTAGLLLAAATLTRPEGLFLFGGFVAHAALDPERPVVGRRRATLRLLLGYVPVVALFVVGMHALYGSYWPNSLDAKVGFSSEQLLRGFHYLRRFTQTYPVPMGILLVGLLGIRGSVSSERLILGIAWGAILFYVLAGGDWMPGYRLFHTVIALSAMLLPFAVARLFAPLTRRPRGLALAVIFAACVACSANLIAFARDPRVSAAAGRGYVHQGIAAGRWMKENLEPGALLATNTAGTIAFYSELPIVDMMGLNDRTIGKRKDLPPAWRGIEKGDGRYVLSRRPDYIQFGSSLGADQPLFLSDLEIYSSPEFWSDYEPVTFEVPATGTLRLFARRASPRTGTWTPQRRSEVRAIVARGIERSGFRY